MCDMTLENKSKYKYCKSKLHNSFVNPHIIRYINSNPNPMKIGDIIRKYFNIPDKKYDKNEVLLLLKLLTAIKSNQR